MVLRGQESAWSDAIEIGPDCVEVKKSTFESQRQLMTRAIRPVRRVNMGYPGSAITKLRPAFSVS